MKVTTAVLVCNLAIVLPVLKAQSPNITGTWIGQFTEAAGGSVPANSGPLQMDLVENPDGGVIGITSSSIEYNGARYSALFSLTGQVTEGVLSFQDMFLFGAAPAGISWCEDSGQLTFSSGSDSATLAGPWQAQHCQGGTFTLTRTISLQPSDSVVNGASFLPGIVPNSWITIRGTNLSATTDTWDKYISNGNLPKTLDGVSVNIGGKPAYIAYVSPQQINAVAPDAGTGQVSVTVASPIGTTAPVTVASQAVAPAFFLWDSKYAVATRQDFSWAVKNGTFPDVTTTPAKPGDVIILWGTGFGPSDPVAPVGVQIPAGTTYSTFNPVTVTVGGLPAQVSGAALASGFTGLYQVAIQIPPSAPDGDLPVIATVAGAQSPSTTLMTVQHDD